MSIHSQHVVSNGLLRRMDTPTLILESILNRSIHTGTHPPTTSNRYLRDAEFRTTSSLASSLSSRSSALVIPSPSHWPLSCIVFVTAIQKAEHVVPGQSCDFPIPGLRDCILGQVTREEFLRNPSESCGGETAGPLLVGESRRYRVPRSPFHSTASSA